MFCSFVSSEEAHHSSLKRLVGNKSVQVCFKCQRFLMKGIEIQIAAIKPDGPRSAKCVHPAGVRKQISEFTCTSQAGVSEWVSLLSVHQIWTVAALHSLYVHPIAIPESEKKFTGDIGPEEGVICYDRHFKRFWLWKKMQSQECAARLDSSSSGCVLWKQRLAVTSPQEPPALRL